MDPELIAKLKKLGFTENEAKIYVGLLSLHEAPARQIHEFTHVPRPKIYSVLERMEKKGYVKIRRGSPAYFRCTNPEQLTSRLRDEFLLYFKETLKEIDSQITEKADISRLGPVI